MDRKVCTKCNEDKPLTEYYLSRGIYESACKPCRRKGINLKNKIVAESHTKIDTSGVKTCSMCNTTKLRVEFSIRRSSSDGLAVECKECATNRTKAFYRTNEGHATMLASRVKNSYVNSREGSEQSDIDKNFLKELLVRQESKCALSGLTLDASNAGDANIRGQLVPSVDRIDSTKGYTKDNVRLVVACLNQAKGPWSDADLLTMASAWMSVRGYSVSPPLSATEVSQ